MSDHDRDAVAEQDRLPWLEPVDEEEAGGGVAAGKLIGALIAALVAIGLIVGGGFWLKQHGTETASNAPATIPAPPEPYKTRPANPGGMQVPGQGDATYSASTGADPNAKIDMSAVAEEPIEAPHPAAPSTATLAKTPPPVAVAKAPPPLAPKPVPVKTAAATPVQQPKAGTITTAKPAVAAVPAKPATQAAIAKPAVKPAPMAPAKASGAQVQLGAFSSQAKADAAWKKLSGKFAFLGSAGHEVVAAKVGSGTVYRLRASGAGAGACSKLKAAGETTCMAIGK